MVLIKCLLRKKEFDLIHGHNYHPAYYYLWRKYFDKKPPLVVHMHITIAAMREKFEKSSFLFFLTEGIRWKISEYFEKLGCQVANAVICVSNSVRNEVLAYYRINPEKVFVINNGVNTASFNPTGKSKRRQLKLKDKKVIMFVGALIPRKRVDLLVKSLSLLPSNYYLLVIGEGKEKRKLMKIASGYSISHRVKFAGFIPYPELAPYYRTADVFCLPSSFEGLPKVILEAIASGVPVISSRSFLTKEDLSQHILWLKENSAEEIATKIKEVVRLNYRMNVNKEARKELDWATGAKKIQDIYKQIIREGA